MQPVALLAGVPVRIHGEHGWDIHDPDGSNPRYRRRRRVLAPIIHRFMAVSRDLEVWLRDRVGLPAAKVIRICNGVDLSRFAANGSKERASTGNSSADAVVVGTVTRFEPIKDPLNLARAFVLARGRLARCHPAIDLRLLMVGDGPLRKEVQEFLESSGEGTHTELPGASADIPHWLARMHFFALGSRREGISNTVLEAMAAGLPVVASATGGNLELVVPSQTGTLVPPEDSGALADALVAYAADPVLRAVQGAAAAERAGKEYSLEVMVDRYADLYQDVCVSRGLAA
jgi:sugar transferase (PEP-CTERM/EpsH1 system associated)